MSCAALKEACRPRGEVYLLSGSTIAFNPEMSVRANTLHFLQPYETNPVRLKEKIAEVEDFVELGNYFDQPVKYCSLGMRARAEFAAATAVNAAIVLVDEILGAGDMYWAERCALRVEEFCRNGRAILLVSHSTSQVLRFCERALWIDSGSVVMEGRRPGGCASLRRVSPKTDLAR